eukprot:4374399-Prymnesium_polylepis.1
MLVPQLPDVTVAASPQQKSLVALGVIGGTTAAGGAGATSVAPQRAMPRSKSNGSSSDCGAYTAMSPGASSSGLAPKESDRLPVMGSCTTSAGSDELCITSRKG